MNIIIGLMDQYDTKIDLIKYMLGQWPIFYGPVILPFHRLELFLYIKK